VSVRLLRTIFENVDDTFVVVRCLQKWFGEDNKEKDDEGKPNKEKQALLDMAKRLDLKRLTPSQLSEIKPCSVFSMEQLYAAFVHQGVAPLASLLCRKVVHVSGAGVDCLNGYYQHPAELNQHYYCKTGNYGSLYCEFRVHIVSGAWTLSIFPLADQGTVFNMYEASSVSFFTIPFTFWKCIDGTAPVPYVAMMEHFERIQNENADPTYTPDFEVTAIVEGRYVVNLHSISAMGKFSQKSFEELRYEDYCRGNRATQASLV
jgi:hypothetical protein